MAENFEIFKELKHQYRSDGTSDLPQGLREFSTKRAIGVMGRGGLGFILRYLRAHPDPDATMKAALVQVMAHIAKELRLHVPSGMDGDFVRWCVWAEENKRERS